MGTRGGGVGGWRKTLAGRAPTRPQIISPSAHPLQQTTAESMREEELIKAAKVTPQQRRNWRMDLIRETDAKRMLLLSRDLNQRRGAVPGCASEPTGPGSKGGVEEKGARGRGKKEAEVEGRRRWR